MPKYPNINVNLIGQDGNAFAIIGNCQKAAKKEKLDQKEINAFTPDTRRRGRGDHPSGEEGHERRGSGR